MCLLAVITEGRPLLYSVSNILAVCRTNPRFILLLSWLLPRRFHVMVLLIGFASREQQVVACLGEPCLNADSSTIISIKNRGALSLSPFLSILHASSGCLEVGSYQIVFLTSNRPPSFSCGKSKSSISGNGKKLEYTSLYICSMKPHRTLHRALYFSTAVTSNLTAKVQCYIGNLSIPSVDGRHSPRPLFSLSALPEDFGGWRVLCVRVLTIG